MKTANNAAAELTDELIKMGFVEAPEKKRVMLGAYDEIGLRTFNLITASGHLNVRVQIHTDGEPEPQSLSLFKFAGDRSQVLAWKSEHMSAQMTLEATLALIKASL